MSRSKVKGGTLTMPLGLRSRNPLSVYSVHVPMKDAQKRENKKEDDGKRREEMKSSTGGPPCAVILIFQLHELLELIEY
jgi:hypothetical protein